MCYSVIKTNRLYHAINTFHKYANRLDKLYNLLVVHDIRSELTLLCCGIILPNYVGLYYLP